MAKLTPEQKLFIVQRLAVFDTPEMVVKAVKEEYGVQVSRQQMQLYIPGSYNARSLSKHLVEAFNETRKRFRDNLEEIPIANKSYRLRALDRMARAAEEKKNYPLAAQLNEQAAKEVGEAYTNKHRHELTGKDGAPIAAKIETTNPVEAAKAYADIIKGS